MKPNYLPITHPLHTSTTHTSQAQEQPAAAGIGLQVLSSEPVLPITLLNLPRLSFIGQRLFIWQRSHASLFSMCVAGKHQQLFNRRLIITPPEHTQV